MYKFDRLALLNELKLKVPFPPPFSLLLWIIFELIKLPFFKKYYLTRELRWFNNPGNTIKILSDYIKHYRIMYKCGSDYEYLSNANIEKLDNKIATTFIQNRKLFKTNDN